MSPVQGVGLYDPEKMVVVNFSMGSWCVCDKLIFTLLQVVEVKKGHL